MKYLLRILVLAVVAGSFITGCSKVDNLRKQDELPLYVKGVSPMLSSSLNTIAPVLADTLRAVVSFNWTNPRYSNDSATTKYIVEIDSAGKDFTSENNKMILGVLNTSFTGRELNAILLNLGLKLGTTQAIDVRVVSSYNNNNERYTSNVVRIAVTPFADPSILTSANASVTVTLANATSPSNTFSWTPAFAGYSGAVAYTLQYDSAGKNFVAPTDIAIGAGMFTRALTQGQMNETALTSGVKGGTTGKVDYRIKAVTASGVVVYSNVSSVLIASYIPILRMYLPGSYQESTGNGNNWDPSSAPELIRDLRPEVFNDMYYTYIFLPAGAEFKVTVGRSWDESFGGSGGDLSSSAGNLTVPDPGYYRVSVNRKTMKYDIRKGRMGFVGGGTGAGWNPPNVFPNYELGAAAKNLFVGLTDFKNGGWKLIDNDKWNDGSSSPDPKDTRSYGTANGSGSTMEINGANFADIVVTPPAMLERKRVIWDGRDVDNIKYEMSPATEMRVVGDGMTSFPEWNPGGSPQMTYEGNGKWTIVIGLKADKSIKFLAGNDWGAFDYEDNSGGSNGVGNARKIKWENGDNFKTPAAAGTYKITLNENLQTVTIANL